MNKRKLFMLLLLTLLRITGISRTTNPAQS